MKKLRYVQVSSLLKGIELRRGENGIWSWWFHSKDHVLIYMAIFYLCSTSLFFLHRGSGGMGSSVLVSWKTEVILEIIKHFAL